MTNPIKSALEAARAHILDAYRIWQADDVSAVPPPMSGAGSAIAKIDAALETSCLNDPDNDPEKENGGEVGSTHEERIALAEALTWDISSITPDDVREIISRLAGLGFELRRSSRPSLDHEAGEAVGEAGEMPGSNGGFTMAAFKASDVPIGTKLYAHPPVQQSEEAAVDAVANFLKERDENVLPDEVDDEERKASAQCILRVVGKVVQPSLGVPVKVKPLEFVSYRDSEGSAPRWLAKHSFGEYRIINNTRDMEFWSPQFGGPSGKCWSSLDEAKAAAQSDFEARILSALSTPPAAQDDLERMREALKPFAEVAAYILAEAPADATMWHAYVDSEGNAAQISLEYLRDAIRALSRDASRDEERSKG